MSGLAMLAKQLAPSLDIPGLLKQFETLKSELPKFARGVKETVDKTESRLGTLEVKTENIQLSINTLQKSVDQVYDLLLQVLAAPNDPHVYPAGPSRVSEIETNGAGV